MREELSEQEEVGLSRHCYRSFYRTRGRAGSGTLLCQPGHPEILLHHPDHPDPLLHHPNNPDLLLHHSGHPGFTPRGPPERRAEMHPVPLPCLALITLLAAVLPSGSEPGLPAPRNVRIDSYNLEHVARWDPVEVMDEPMPVVYSVRFEMDGQITRMAEQNRTYFGRYSDLRDLCTNITDTECNFTDKILPFYRGRLKVQAESGSRKSDWAVTPDFQPSRHTIIGPVKSLVLRSHSGNLTVDFSPPFSPIPSGWVMKYNVSYWKANSEEVKTVQPDSKTTYLLGSLETHTNYCVQVYAFTHYINGLASDPLCETTATGITLIVVLGCVCGFVFLFGIMSLLIIPDKPLHKARTRIKNWLDGPYRIPSDILEYLEDPPDLMECNLYTTEELCDHISIVGLEQAEEACPDHSRPGSEKT